MLGQTAVKVSEAESAARQDGRRVNTRKLALIHQVTQRQTETDPESDRSLSSSLSFTWWAGECGRPEV